MSEDNIVEVSLKNNMKGVFVLVDCEPGRVIRELSMNNTSQLPTRTSIHVGNSVHVEDPVGIYINHSCNPTCKVVGAQVISIVSLSKGDEVTFDYLQNEVSIAAPFVCGCCGKTIQRES